MRELAERIAAAPVGWLPACVLATEAELDAAERAGWLARYDREEGRYETLTPWAAAELGVHLIEVGGGEGAGRALAFSTPEPGEAVTRWTPTAYDEEGVRIEDGPAPVQPRERPCVRRVTAWDLMAVRRVPADEPGGRGRLPDGDGRRERVRRLLLEAERERCERERAARRRCRRRGA